MAPLTYNFREKSFLTLMSILFVFKPNLIPRCTLYPFWCVPNLKIIQLCIACYGSFCKCAKRKKKREKKKPKKMSNFLWRLIFQEQLVRFTSDLVYVLSRYAGTCTANLVLFGQETTELRMRIKSHFVLRINIIMLCAHVPFSWAAQHTTVCLDKDNSQTKQAINAV